MTSSDATEQDCDAIQADSRNTLLQWFFEEDRKLAEFHKARIEEKNREAQQIAQWTDIETDGRYGIMQELQAQRSRLLQQWVNEEADRNKQFDHRRLAYKALSSANRGELFDAQLAVETHPKEVPQIPTPLSESQPQLKALLLHGQQNPTERLSKSAQTTPGLPSSIEAMDGSGELPAGPLKLGNLVAHPKSRHAEPDSTTKFDEISKVVSRDEHLTETVEDGFDISDKNAQGICWEDEGRSIILGQRRAKRKRTKKGHVTYVASTPRTGAAEDGDTHAAVESVQLQNGAEKLFTASTGFAADLEDDGYTSHDSYSGDPTNSTEWRLFQVKQVGRATNPSVTQYWVWSDKATFKHMVLAETDPDVMWDFLKDFNFHIRLSEMKNVIYAAGSNVVIIQTGVKNRGDILVKFKRDRTKRRFLTFIFHKGIKLQETVW